MYVLVLFIFLSFNFFSEKKTVEQILEFSDKKRNLHSTVF